MPARATMRKFQTEMKRRDLLDYIIDYKQENDGNSPTMRQIMENLSYSSTSVVTYNLNVLENQGLIKRQYGDARGIIVTGGQWVYEGAGQ